MYRGEAKVIFFLACLSSISHGFNMSLVMVEEQPPGTVLVQLSQTASLVEFQQTVDGDIRY